MLKGFVNEIDHFLLNCEKCSQEEREEIIKLVNTFEVEKLTKNDLVGHYIEDSQKYPKMTFDEFFDKHNVPKDARTDFGITAILKQAKERINQRGGKNEY